jgi:hypothetical protein
LLVRDGLSLYITIIAELGIGGNQIVDAVDLNVVANRAALGIADDEGDVALWSAGVGGVAMSVWARSRFCQATAGLMAVWARSRFCRALVRLGSTVSA